MAIIGVFGYAGSGKDTVGKLIQYNMSRGSRIPIEEVIEDYNIHEWWLEEMSGWEIKKWAGKLKYIASIITGIPVEKFEDQEFKKTNLGPEWNITKQYESGAPWIAEGGEAYEEPMTVRDLLQILGTEAMRDGLHKNVWVNALMADYTPTQVQWSQGPLGGYEDGPMPNWIITDTRFPNEAQAIKDKGGMVIKVERPGVGPVNRHPSEDALKDYNFDYVIHNDGSINDLDNKVIEFINNYIFTPN
jgi:hypothetical protein